MTREYYQGQDKVEIRSAVSTSGGTGGQQNLKTVLKINRIYEDMNTPEKRENVSGSGQESVVSLTVDELANHLGCAGESTMIEHVYRIGYVTREKERDYDPMGNDVVCEAVEKWHRFQLLAKAVADGNFNQVEIIKEARELSA